MAEPLLGLLLVLSKPVVIRKRMRLRDYDYSQAGAYFVTICTHRSIPLLGTIANSKFQLNQIGGLVLKTLEEIPMHYPGVELDAIQIMPDHLHAILFFIGSFEKGVMAKPDIGLPSLIQRYKSLTSRRYGIFRRQNQKTRLPEKLWQRGYYDRILRNDNDLEEKREYIITNPLRWELKQQSG